MSSEFTPSPDPATSDDEAIRQRQVLRRGLRRANVAWVVIVAVITALTFGVVWKARQSAREADRANRSAAEALTQAARAEGELWNAHLAEARAIRIAGGPGARSKARALIQELSVSPSLTETQRLALRTEAVAQLALVDIVPPESWVTQRVIFKQTWDKPMRRYVQSFETNQIEIRSHPSGQTLTTLFGPNGALRQEARFSPDGRYFVCVFRKPSVAICWRLEDSAIVFSNRTTSVLYLEVPFFSPDSRTLAVATTNGLELYPLERSAPPVVLPRSPNASFSPDSRWVASVQTTNAEIRSAATGRLLGRLPLEFKTDCLAWHPDGTRLALAGHDGKIVLQELPEDILSREPRFGPPLGAASPTAAAESASTVFIPGAVRSLDGHVGKVIGVWFSPDGSMLLSQSWDSFSILWDVPTGRRLMAESRVALEGFSPDGERVFAIADGGGRQGSAGLLSRSGYRSVVQAGKMPRLAVGVAFSRDGRLAITDHLESSLVWNTATGREVARLRGHSAVFAPDSRTVCTVVTNAVFGFDLTSVPLVAEGSNWLTATEIFHRDSRRGDVLNTASLAPDGRTLVVAASEGGVILIDLRKESPPRRIKTPAHFASLSADGQWLVAQKHNNEAWLVNMTNTAKPWLIGYHLNAAFSPDGTRLAVTTEKVLVLLQRNAAHSNGWSRLWRVPLEIGAGEPAPFAFTPDGAAVAVPYNRFDIRLFDARNGQELATFSPPNLSQIGGKETLAFSDDGQRLRALRNDGEVIEWTLPTVRAALAGLGLDWRDDAQAEPSIPAFHQDPARSQKQPHPDPAPALARSTSTGAGGISASASPSKSDVQSSNLSLPSVAAAVAGVLALIAGAVLFLHQRRTVAAYARSEALAEAQQQQLVQAQAALFQSQKMEALGTLAAGVAHDFNNLLSIIRMSKQLVDRAVKPEGLTKENLEAIEQAVHQGKSLVNSMLGYSRRPTEAIEDFSVVKVVGDTVALLSRQFLGGLTLNLQLDQSCPLIHGSRARLEQALLNLIVNASEAMKGSGALTIKARPIDSSAPAADGVLQSKDASAGVELSVSDTGPGIAPDVLPRVFEPFFTTKTVGMQRGTGRGLSLVYAIAKQDGWGLGVQTGPGGGTTFTLVLPASQTALLGRRLPTSQGADVSGKLNVT